MWMVAATTRSRKAVRKFFFHSMEKKTVMGDRAFISERTLHILYIYDDDDVFILFGV
jgi:hypothetical protein